MRITAERRAFASGLLAIGLVAIVAGLLQVFLSPGTVRLVSADGTAIAPGAFDCRSVLSNSRGWDNEPLTLPQAYPVTEDHAAVADQHRRKCDDRRSSKATLGAGLIGLGVIAVLAGWALQPRRPTPELPPLS